MNRPRPMRPSPTTPAIPMRPTVLIPLIALLTITCTPPSPTNHPPSPHSIATIQPDQIATTSDPRNPKILLANSDCTIVDPGTDAAISSRGYFTVPIVSEVHAGLMKFVEQGATTTIEPDLAERYTTSDNGQSYRFILRRDLKFSDGSPIRAEDFQWSWERALKIAGTTGRALNILGNIQGATDVAHGRATNLLGIQIPDERTLIVDLNQPSPDFPMRVADPVAAVLKEDNVSAWGMQFANADDLFDAVTDWSQSAFLDIRRPVGVGPFRIVSYSPLSYARTCVIEKNPYYWGPKPAIDYIVFVDLANSHTDDDLERAEKSAYSQDEVDYIFLTPDEAADITSRQSDIQGNVTHTDSVPSTMFLTLNPAIPPFDDLNFRKAVVAATDIESMFQPWPVRWQRRILPEELVNDTSRDLEAVFDPEAAQTYIASSKYPDGFSDVIPLMFSEHHPFPDRFRRLADRWSQLINLNVEPSPTDAAEISEAATNGTLPIRVIDAYPTYPDPNAVYYKIRTALANPTGTWELNELNSLIDSAASHPDAAERNRLKIVVERFLRDQALAIPLIQNWGGPHILTKPWLQNFKVPQFPASTFQHATMTDDTPKRDIQNYIR